MSLTTFFIGLTLGLVTIGWLVWVIVKLLHKDRIRTEQIKSVQQQYQAARANHIESIQILLKVAGTEELGWVEASIRIKVLLDQLGIDLSEHESIGVFYKMYVQTEHIPTHDAWNALPKSAKASFRKTFKECEEQYAQALLDGKSALQTYPLV